VKPSQHVVIPLTLSTRTAPQRASACAASSRSADEHTPLPQPCMRGQSPRPRSRLCGVRALARGSDAPQRPRRIHCRPHQLQERLRAPAPARSDGLTGALERPPRRRRAKQTGGRTDQAALSGTGCRPMQPPGSGPGGRAPHALYARCTALLEHRLYKPYDRVRVEHLRAQELAVCKQVLQAAAGDAVGRGAHGGRLALAGGLLRRAAVRRLDGDQAARADQAPRSAGGLLSSPNGSSAWLSGAIICNNAVTAPAHDLPACSQEQWREPCSPL